MVALFFQSINENTATAAQWCSDVVVAFAGLYKSQPFLKPDSYCLF